MIHLEQPADIDRADTLPLGEHAELAPQRNDRPMLAAPGPCLQVDRAHHILRAEPTQESQPGLPADRQPQPAGSQSDRNRKYGANKIKK